ncbi:hypothetical protein Tco_0371411 [Tanacetum coccineum]
MRLSPMNVVTKVGIKKFGSKRVDFGKNNSNQVNQDYIGEYGLMIDDDDFEYTCDYLLSKDAPFTIDNEEGRLEETRYKLLGTPHERIASIEQEFDNWAKTNGYIGINDQDPE